MSPIVAGGLLIYFCDYNEIIINGYSATKKRINPSDKNMLSFFVKSVTIYMVFTKVPGANLAGGTQERFLFS